MAGSLFFVLFVLLCSFAALTAARKFDKPAAKVAVKLAGLAYCPTASYESKRFTDRSGVTVTKTIDKESTDVQVSSRLCLLDILIISHLSSKLCRVLLVTTVIATKSMS